ncbi:MAG: tetratricopeptide repeat protein, partial [Candidatus Binatia bacterium]
MIDPKIRWLHLGIFCTVLVSMQACAPTALEKAGELSLAKSLSDQGLLYIHQGKYSQAEPLLKRALAIYEKVLEPNHRDVARALDNLGALYAQGKYCPAEPLLKRALAIYEKVLEPDHLAVARALNDLGTLYGNQGKYSQAEPLLKRALAIYEKVLEPNHRDVASVL